MIGLKRHLGDGELAASCILSLAEVTASRRPSDGRRTDTAKVQPAVRFSHAGHRPVASRGVLQVVHHLSFRVEPENPGHAS